MPMQRCLTIRQSVCSVTCKQALLSQVAVLQGLIVLHLSSACVQSLRQQVLLDNAAVCQLPILLLHTRYSVASVTWSMCMLQVFTAAVFSFAHGSNDVANSIGPFATIYGIYQNEGVSSSSKIPTWILVVGMDLSCHLSQTQRAQLCSLCMNFLCRLGPVHCGSIVCKHCVQSKAMRCFNACGWQIMSMCINIATAMHSTILQY